MTLTITDAAGNEVQALALNENGWPTLNAATGTAAYPLTVRVDIANPGTATKLQVDFGAQGSAARFGFPERVDGSFCGTVTYGDSSVVIANPSTYNHTAEICWAPSELGATYSWQVPIHPSATAELTVSAQLIGATSGTSMAEASVQIPEEQVRPVIFIPGISGSYLD
ncbi:MAG TPA: hypothetical protein VFT66_16030, partial [Roseiflexaceae bacterium]|nr:hypothetical protein [Roseiflexaceae bacterium]